MGFPSFFNNIQFKTTASPLPSHNQSTDWSEEEYVKFKVAIFLRVCNEKYHLPWWVLILFRVFQMWSIYKRDRSYTCTKRASFRLLLQHIPLVRMCVLVIEFAFILNSHGCVIHYVRVSYRDATHKFSAYASSYWLYIRILFFVLWKYFVKVFLMLSHVACVWLVEDSWNGDLERCSLSNMTFGEPCKPTFVLQ